MTDQVESRVMGQSTRRVLKDFGRNWWVVLLVALIVGAIALVYSSTQTRVYRSSATLYVTSGSEDSAQAAYQGSLASQQRVRSYIRLVTTDAVVSDALSSAGLNLDLDQAERSLSAESTTDTVLLTISATSGSAGGAARLANAAAQAMARYVSVLETPAGGGRPAAKLTIVTPAMPNATPVSPKIARNTLLGVAVGLLVGVMSVVLASRYSNKVREESDIALSGDTPVLGLVPVDDLLKRRGLIDFKGGATPAAEAFRKIRTNLTFSNVDNPPRAILVTSPIAVEGKTTTAMNLASALVESGSRVVLVDADLRRPQVDTRSGLIGNIGLTNALRGDGDLADLVQASTIDGLFVLASGPRPPNPAELLASKRAGATFEELRSHFDYVIVDSAPVLPVTDSTVLAQWVDGIVLVARSGSTKVDDLADAYGQLATSGTAVIGFVLTEAPDSKGRYGYYAVNPNRRKFFGKHREPKAIEQVLEPRASS